MPASCGSWSPGALAEPRIGPWWPPLKEIGIDMVVDAPYGTAGPKGMDPKIVEIRHDAFSKGMEDPSCAAVLAQLDQESSYMDSQDYHDFAMQQIAEQASLVEELGLKQDWCDTKRIAGSCDEHNSGTTSPH